MSQVRLPLCQSEEPCFNERWIGSSEHDYGYSKRNGSCNSFYLALAEFESLVDPMYRAMQENNIQSSKLSELRDALLPRLMSGEIDVSDIQL